MGTSLMTVRRIERGEVLPNVDTAERYASAVGAHLVWDLEELKEELPATSRPEARVNVEWGLDDPMAGTVVGVHGSPDRIWLQVELDDGPTIDVPAASVTPRRRRTRRTTK
jgi:transcriptional regulator with XRE-family HTH domain